MAPSSTDHKFGAANRAKPQHCSMFQNEGGAGCERPRVAAQAVGIGSLPAAPGAVPAPPHPSAAAPCIHTCPDHTNPTSCSPGHHPLHHGGTSGDTCLQD